MPRSQSPENAIMIAIKAKVVPSRGLSDMVRAAVSRKALKSRLKKCTAASSFQPIWQAGSILTARQAASRALSSGFSPGLNRSKYSNLYKLEKLAQAGAGLGIDLLHEGVVAQDKFGRAEFLQLSISSGGGHGANQNSIPIRDGGHDVVGEVILNLECARVADFAVIGLGPKLRAAHGVHQLRADANGAPSFAYAPLDHIARA